MLGRVYDIVFNYLKTNIDTIPNAPLSDDVDDKLLELVCTNLGFKGFHNYNINQLKALCSIFNIVIRNKGNIQSIQMVLNMLTNIENVTTLASVVVDDDDTSKITVFIPEEIKDITIFEDVLDYILPAGMQCEIIQQKAIKTYSQTELSDESVTFSVYKKAVDTSRVAPAKLNIEEGKEDKPFRMAGVVGHITVLPANQDVIKDED